jgi:hypothetical protein
MVVNVINSGMINTQTGVLAVRLRREGRHVLCISERIQAMTVCLIYQKYACFVRVRMHSKQRQICVHQHNQSHSISA